MIRSANGQCSIGLLQKVGQPGRQAGLKGGGGHGAGIGLHLIADEELMGGGIGELGRRRHIGPLLGKQSTDFGYDSPSVRTGEEDPEAVRSFIRHWEGVVWQCARADPDRTACDRLRTRRPRRRISPHRARH